MITFSHPTGNQNLRALLIGADDAGLLESFHTAIGAFEGALLFRAGQLPGLGEFRRRSFAPQLRAKTHQHPWMDLIRVISKRVGLSRLHQTEASPFSIDAVYASLDRTVANYLDPAKVQAVYAYEDGAIHSFERAGTLGMQRLYDLPIGYWRAAVEILEAEAEAKPAWANTIRLREASQAKLERKDRELALADEICVASSFTASTLTKYPGLLPTPILVPYGFPTVTESRRYRQRVAGSPIRALFVGGLSQRKGISYVFEAATTLGPVVELTVVGHRPSLPNAALDAALAKCTYIPSLPHDQILAIMRDSDVLLFPSLFEGFGLVITEAMSQGTPVITTANTAGPDIIEHGTDGWIVPIGTAAPIVEILEELVRRPELATQVGQAAQAKASLRPWRAYGDEMAAKIAGRLPASASTPLDLP